MIPVNTKSTRREAGIALLAGLTGVASSFAIAANTAQFVVAPIDDLVVRLTPSALVTWMIVNVGDQSHLLHIGLSVAIAAGLFAVTALVGFEVARRADWPVVGPVLTGVMAWALSMAIVADPVSAVASAVPVALFTAAGISSLPDADHDPSRRQVLVYGASALAFVGASVLLGRQETGVGVGEGDGNDPISDEVTELLQLAEDRSLDLAATDLPGLVSSIEEFYKVDINSFDPEVSPEEWSLTVNGEVEESLTIGYDELIEMPAEHRFVTLRCVGENLNGHKMDNALWTVTPIKPLLERADPAGKCGCAMLHASDGYSVQIPIEALENSVLAWEMNGRPLPKAHGQPVRILVPGHWGETNVKWLDEIELLDEEMDGYWEQRGWRGTGPVNTVAKLWADTRLDETRVEIAGHAYAGTRGVERVEVSTDGGTTWNPADLSEPLPGDDVWRQWRYVLETEGPQDVVVRAVDGEGTVQVRERSQAFPSGATGWVSETVGE